VNLELEECVLDSLRSVIDPETGVDVVRMRLVQGLEIDDKGVVRYTFHPSSPLCPLAVTLALQVKQAIAHVPGVDSQEITIEGYIDAEGLSELLGEV
jgi:metal-sulfur cluster biosynthetic enzyme